LGDREQEETRYERHRETLGAKVETVF